MSTCNCDGTVSYSILEETFTGDPLLTGIQLNPLLGGFDPRPNACQQAADTLRAQGQDPCNLDSPDDLQVLYKANIAGVVTTGQQTPLSNPIQQQADIIAGTATFRTSVTGSIQKQQAPTNWTFIIGAIAILAIGFFLVFRA